MSTKEIELSMPKDESATSARAIQKKSARNELKRSQRGIKVKSCCEMKTDSTCGGEFKFFFVL
jgi:hypothetical protein